MYFVGVRRDVSGNFYLSLAKKEDIYEYEDHELLNHLRQTVEQIGPIIRKCVVYIEDTFDSSHAMEIGWKLILEYGCAAYVYDDDKEKYVQLEVLTQS